MQRADSLIARYLVLQVATAMLLITLAILGAPASMLAQPPVERSPLPTAPGTTAKVRSWNDPAIATLMLVDDIGPEARAVVIRRPGDMPNNIILVTRATTPADLAQAVSTLIASRRSRGDVVDREMRALIGAKPRSVAPARARKAAAAPARKETAPSATDAASASRGAPPARVPAQGGSPSPSVSLAAADLERLRAAPDFEIRGIGRGPALVIRMKALRGAKKDQ